MAESVTGVLTHLPAIVQKTAVNKCIAFAGWQQRAAIRLGSATHFSCCLLFSFEMLLFLQCPIAVGERKGIQPVKKSSAAIRQGDTASRGVNPETRPDKQNRKVVVLSSWTDVYFVSQALLAHNNKLSSLKCGGNIEDLSGLRVCSHIGSVVKIRPGNVRGFDSGRGNARI